MRRLDTTGTQSSANSSCEEEPAYDQFEQCDSTTPTVSDGIFGRIVAKGLPDPEVGGFGFIESPQREYWALTVQDAARRIVVAGMQEGHPVVYGFQA
ncbi:hypothetical protein [Pseudomonas sp. MWU13-2105]|uniref:hypothetical protein n=1 Tax=Pseudomonas sp. MWU13-2105 TaxID=2935074 RepID=UPI00200EAFB4|nr:hypothetical protein [Pseudomonas sp. MWU13-2105]